MSDIEIKTKAGEIIKNLVTLPYCEIFQISPAERDLINLHIQAPHLVEPLLGMMFTAIMLGNKRSAVDAANKIWNIGGELPDELEMLFSDCLVNVGEFEKAKTLINSRMEDVKKNLGLFYSTVVKYALCTGELYVLNNLAKYPEVYVSEPALFNFAERYFEGMANKHYNAVLKIIYDNVSDILCAVEYLNHPDGGIQLCLYTSANGEENAKIQNIIFNKIDGYFASMQENNKKDIYVRLENVNLHPAWW